MNVPKRGLVGLAVLGGVVAGLGACGTPHEPHGFPPAASPIGQQTVLTASRQGAPSQNFTALRVTITNHSTSVLDSNPFFFTVIDTAGAKHPAYVTGASSELAAMSLRPGEHSTGKLTFRGSFKPKILTFEENGFDETARTFVK